MRKYSWLRYLLGGLLILVVALVLPRYMKNLKNNMRIQNALNFPAEGYLYDHDSLVLEATARVYTESGSDNMQPMLTVNVDVTNTGERSFKNIIGAAKTDHLEKYCFHGVGSFRVRMFEPVTLDSGRNPPAGLGFSMTTPLKPLEADEFEQLLTQLEEPLFIKLVHDEGTELLLLKPEIIVEI